MKNGKRMTIAAAVAFTVMLTGIHPVRTFSADVPKPARQYDVRILRDSWGVPHIFGKTDADAAFGLAYAHAQDDFKTMQGILMAVHGRLAELLGPRGGGNDFLVHLIRLWDTVDEKYEKDLSPRTRALCEAYADGVNRYAALHPDEAVKGFYPISGKTIVAGFVHKMPLMVGVDKVLMDLFADEPPAEVKKPEKDDRKAALDAFPWTGAGSNAIAVSPTRSAGGKTFLAVNSHQPWEGPVSWYEVHLHSEEGWNMTGGIFPGAPIVLHGHNEHLGWAHTNNYPDLVDVYTLEINPDNPDQYRYDGKWINLEVRQAPIKAKLLGPLTWTVKKEVCWSVYGPVVRRPHGVYAISYAGLGDVRQVEQWYRMNKARTFDQWYDAVRMRTLPMFNCTYADREGNIFYIYTSILPLRKEGFNWAGHVPGNTSKTRWMGYLPIDRLPQVKNPSSGFVMNCNNNPFMTTVGPGNPRRGDFAATLGIDAKVTNRGLRALELFGADPSITEDEFYRYKYDMAYSTKSKMAQMVRRVLALPPSGDPLDREAAALLGKWDLHTGPDSAEAALAVVTYTLLDSFKDRQVEDVADAAIAGKFREAARLLKKHHGRLDVEWQKVNRLIRGKTDLGLGGGPDVLHDVTGDLQKDGRFKGRQGDSYLMLVSWDRDGRLKSRSIHVYGSATLDERSKHYADQSPLFARRELKDVWMTEAEVRAHLEREYRPGEEIEK